MDVQQIFLKNALVPDILTSAPTQLLKITYADKLEVECGMTLTPAQVKKPPVVKWTDKPSEYYTLCMTDPDAPSREKPKFREWHHWLVGNIPEGNVDQGNALTEYVGAGPPRGSGLHRYVFLLYKQPDKIDYSSVNKISDKTSDRRAKFSITKFAAKHQLGVPIAGNFFFAEYDDYVPKLYAQLGI